MRTQFGRCCALPLTAFTIANAAAAVKRIRGTLRSSNNNLALLLGRWSRSRLRLLRRRRRGRVLLRCCGSLALFLFGKNFKLCHSLRKSLLHFKPAIDSVFVL